MTTAGTRRLSGAYGRRLLSVGLGLAVSAVGIVMMLQANIGLEPWSVLQKGLSQTLGITYGTASVLVGAAAIGVAVACGEGFGVGTILNIVLCAIFIDLLLALGWIPQMTALLPGVVMLLGGLELLALGTWLYMRAGLGAGPRDALMVALARRSGRSVGLCRAVVELGVILLGWLLGGQVGLGTVLSAVGLGSLFNLNFALLRFQASQLHQENVKETLSQWRNNG
ncbi:YczE/YyaS/YitT family protein [Flavonifractor hominis]|uniref:YitT family protein n=1 Tax=Flavonifractor hominis TaxID=3133178 RepID=A0ABV1EPJ1_9FIRM